MLKLSQLLFAIQLIRSNTMVGKVKDFFSLALILDHRDVCGYG